MREVNGEMHDESTQPPSIERYPVYTPPIPTSDTNRDNIWRWSQREGQGESYDESTQPPIVQINIPRTNPILGAISTRDNIEEEAMVPDTNVGQQKRGRGPAKCTEFDKLRRHGKVPLKINDGETAPCCENASFFTTRVTWILKHHADMSFARWTDVPKSVKDELIDRVRGDFELDWELKNHQLAVWKQLRKRFNAFHHELYKKYLAYASHEEALAGGTSLVSPLVWVKLCGRWGSDHFKVHSIIYLNLPFIEMYTAIERKRVIGMQEDETHIAIS
ncbi:uncharacterized protein LOC122310280 [Carya illinoinensis]|uniref:uncharacterized protein LOC122310280 n=1 Tax=Carya illinoinensis TaxID=32201 RepID=UPI001C723886|nr:uncharacterized protein LOC122310280 [Carya illinoinensis]